MMKKFNYAFLALLFLLAMACKKDPRPPPPLPDVNCNRPTNNLSLSRQLIVGTWRYKRYVFYGINGWIRRDVDTAQIDYQFRNDGTLWYYKKGEFIDSCRYEIDIMKKYTLYQGDTTRNTLWLINRKIGMGLASLVPIWVCNDSLYLPYQSFRYDTVQDYYFYRIK